MSSAEMFTDKLSVKATCMYVLSGVTDYLPQLFLTEQLYLRILRCNMCSLMTYYVYLSSELCVTCCARKY